jgi:hypothetical protein
VTGKDKDDEQLPEGSAAEKPEPAATASEQKS